MGYSLDEAVNCTLQMQVRREVEKLKGNVSTSASAVYDGHDDSARVNLAGGK